MARDASLSGLSISGATAKPFREGPRAFLGAQTICNSVATEEPVLPRRLLSPAAISAGYLLRLGRKYLAVTCCRLLLFLRVLLLATPSCN
jgi:hypothetical protein